jgi:nucleotide-binding universal stress UspA family protein
MKGLTSIVVGLDFSECSRVALGHARRVASWAGAEVHPVHVVDAPVDEMGEDATLTAMQRGIREGLVEDARRQWDTFIEGTPGATELHLEVRVAHRLVGIRQQLDHHKADLLVLGAFGEERPNVGMGTLASACIRSVPTDVLIVRDTYREPFRTVVVGIDFSATCQRALEAAALVANGDGARLYAVYVESTKAEAYAWVHGDAPLNLQSFVKPTADRYPGLEVHAKVFPYSGHRSGVLEFAALVNADLIAVGTRGRSNLRDVVLGSTAEKVVRDSVCAVWAAKPRL